MPATPCARENTLAKRVSDLFPKHKFKSVLFPLFWEGSFILHTITLMHSFKKRLYRTGSQMLFKILSSSKAICGKEYTSI